jgi:hypothetical protein
MLGSIKRFLGFRKTVSTKIVDAFFLDKAEYIMERYHSTLAKIDNRILGTSYDTTNSFKFLSDARSIRDSAIKLANILGMGKCRMCNNARITINHRREYHGYTNLNPLEDMFSDWIAKWNALNSISNPKTRKKKEAQLIVEKEATNRDLQELIKDITSNLLFTRPSPRVIPSSIIQSIFWIVALLCFCVEDHKKI